MKFSFAIFSEQQKVPWAVDLKHNIVDLCLQLKKI